MNLHYRLWSSGLTRLHLAATDSALIAIGFDSNWPRISASFGCEPVEGENPIIEKTIGELEEYFQGRRREFTVATEPRGTPFQKMVWRSLSAVPFGATMTYAEQAELLRKPSAVRAVGTANGRNPISIVIPCHRVIGSTGALTGYAGGLDIKRRLLETEGFFPTPSR